jgi:hypothetical protein
MLPLKPVEIAVPGVLPESGSRTSQLKVVNEEFSPRQAAITFDALLGSVYDLGIHLNRPHIAIDGAQISGGKLHLEFPRSAQQAPETTYQRKTVKFVW